MSASHAEGRGFEPRPEYTFVLILVLPGKNGTTRCYFLLL